MRIWSAPSGRLLADSLRRFLDAKEAAERATRAETRASEIERRADDLNAELARVHEQNAALIAALAKPAADTDKG